MIEVSCRLGRDADLFHLAKIVTGLCELEARNEIRLTLTASPEMGPYAIALRLAGVVVGIDLSDHCEELQPELADCDVYLKRSVRRQVFRNGGRIRPFGLNYACRSWRASLRLLRLFGPNDVARRWNVWKKFLSIPVVREFERPPHAPASQTILFQARLWELVDCPGDEQINEERVSLLTALKAEFGERVVGGLASTSYAIRFHPQLVTNLPSRQSRYVRWAREPLISIGFRGLFGSLGFKLAESLAASQCLMFQPADSFLSEDVPVIGYGNIHDCITGCDYYLTHRAEADRLRSRAWSFYQENVRPCSHIRKLLKSVQDGKN